MNTSYTMWDLEEKDWDAVKDQFLPEFLNLDDSVSNELPISTAHLKELYTDILGDLKDHHAVFQIKNLWASETDDENFRVFPSYIEVSKRDYYHPSHINSSKMAYRLKDETAANQTGHDLWNSLTMVAWLRKLESEGRATDIKYGSTLLDMSALTVVSGLIDGNIPYLHISDFLLSSLFLLAAENNPSKAVMDTYEAYESFKNNVLELDEVKGVIIDLRENGGGYYNDEFYLASLLLDRPVQMGWCRYKSGLGRYDYSPWIPLVFSPAQQHRAIDGPLVVVSDIYSVSMAEITTMLVKSMPNGCFIGERTFGGHGILSPDFENYYSGTFGKLDGNHYAYLSTHTVKDYNGNILEGRRVTPDIEMDYYQGTFSDGEDTWLERAVEYINTGR